ncbi:MAG: HepT-like ribonuclease domain-containing protein [Cellulosilyticaceae bacterium]
MINNDRILKLLLDLKEWEEEYQAGVEALSVSETEKMSKIISHSLRAYFLDFHIWCEDFISIYLKALKKFRIDLSAIEGMELLKDEGVVSETFYRFYASSRRLRNRLAHRYKLPGDGELIDNINDNHAILVELENALKDLLNKA